jgi:hypothetical protein
MGAEYVLGLPHGRQTHCGLPVPQPYVQQLWVGCDVRMAKRVSVTTIVRVAGVGKMPIRVTRIVLVEAFAWLTQERLCVLMTCLSRMLIPTTDAVTGLLHRAAAEAISVTLQPLHRTILPKRRRHFLLRVHCLVVFVTVRLGTPHLLPSFAAVYLVTLFTSRARRMVRGRGRIYRRVGARLHLLAADD